MQMEAQAEKLATEMQRDLLARAARAKIRAKASMAARAQKDLRADPKRHAPTKAKGQLNAAKKVKAKLESESVAKAEAKENVLAEATAEMRANIRARARSQPSMSPAVGPHYRGRKPTRPRPMRRQMMQGDRPCVRPRQRNKPHERESIAAPRPRQNKPVCTNVVGAAKLDTALERRAQPKYLALACNVGHCNNRQHKGMAHRRGSACVARKSLRMANEVLHGH